MLLHDHYWKEFYRLKVHARYIGLQQGLAEKNDRRVKVFTAIASSSSIGAWVIWKNLGPLWGMVIAISQVLNAIRPYLPYRRRLTSLSSLAHELEELAISAEMIWLDIATGDLSEDEIKKAIRDVKQKKQKAIRKYLPDTQLPEKSSLLDKAEDDTLQYCATFYS